MNYVVHLNNFFALMRRDTHLRPCHISLYMALFHRWNEVHFSKTFLVHRETIMKTSRIGSKHTFLKCLRDLHHSRYILYQPPLNRFSAGKVYIRPLTSASKPPAQQDLFTGTGNAPEAGSLLTGPGIESDTGPGSILTDDGTESGTGPGSKVVHFNKQLNKLINSANRQRTEKNIDHPIPSAAEVAAWFQQKKHPAAEAEKFFLHFESTGWHTSRNTPIVNWQAAADKWMLTIPTLKKPSAYGKSNAYLHTQNDKDYSEPL